MIIVLIVIIIIIIMTLNFKRISTDKVTTYLNVIFYYNYEKVIEIGDFALLNTMGRLFKGSSNLNQCLTIVRSTC